MEPPDRSRSAENAPLQSRGGRKSIVVIACEPCRKRKVRCSGAVPCSMCQRQSVECYLNTKRRRRGPRPRNRQEEPFPPAGGIEAEAEAEAGPEPEATTSEPHPQEIMPQKSLLIRGQGFTTSSYASWKRSLRTLMGGDFYLLASQTTVSIDLTLHLILIYCGAVNSQQSPVVCPDIFLNKLERGRGSRSLCHAMASVSVKYSRHRLMKEFTDLEIIYSLDARREMQKDSNMYHLEIAQALCILSMYESTRGAGFQAWYDITTALSMIHLLKSNLTTSQENLTAVEMIEKHLCLSEVLQTLGHRTMSFHRLVLSESSDRKEVVVGIAPNLALVLSKTFDILVRIEHLSRIDFTKQIPAPWAPTSDFMSIKRDLDELQVHFASELNFTKEKLQHFLIQETGAGEYIHCCLSWHCCVLLLNRVFLPIYVTETKKTNEVGVTAEGNGGSTIRTLQFPAAPKTFLQERETACRLSSTSIVNICSQILGNGLLIIPPFMGYCCFQTCLILINQLHSREKAVIPAVTENLKIVFTLLGAMRPFYAPANIWLESLFVVHSPDNLVHTHLLSISCLFSNYFARFPTIKEPSFAALDLSDEITEPKQRAHQIAKTLEAAGDNNTERTFHAPEKNRERTWLEEYQHQVESNLSSLDLELENTGTGNFQVAAGHINLTPEPSHSLAVLDQGSQSKPDGPDERPGFMEDTGSGTDLAQLLDTHLGDMPYGRSSVHTGAAPHILQQSGVDNPEFNDVDFWNLENFSSTDLEQYITLDGHFAAFSRRNINLNIG